MEVEEENKNEDRFLSDEIKWQIVSNKKEGKGDRQVAREVAEEFDRPSISHATASFIWNKYRDQGNVDNNWNQDGRPKILSERDEQPIINLCREERNISNSQIKQTLDLNVSERTINNMLQNNGYNSYRAPKKFLLSQQNIANMLQYAQDYLDWETADWSTIVFSDECSFSCVSSSGRIRVRSLHDDKFQDDTVQPYSSGRIRVRSLHDDKFQDDTKIMVWGAISYDGVGPLALVQSTLNAQEYLKMIRLRLNKFYADLYGGDLTWQQDNARAHKNQLLDNWFESKNIEVMQSPAQSPDLSIIEDVWNSMKFSLAGQVFNDTETLWRAIKKQWNNIPQQTIRNLYKSLPKRIQALSEARGKHTKY